MDSEAALRFLGVDPAALEPAPPSPSWQAARDRIHGPPHPCVRCGATATVTQVVDTPLGPRWLDICMRHFVAAAKA